MKGLQLSLKVVLMNVIIVLDYIMVGFLITFISINQLLFLLRFWGLQIAHWQVRQKLLEQQKLGHSWAKYHHFNMNDKDSIKIYINT